LLYTMIFVNLAATNPSLPQIVMKLSPIWKFAADPNDEGITKLWYADDFDDSSWKTLQSGLTWEAQGVLSQGFGWYRQKFFIPQDYQGTSLVLTFASLPSDDDVFVNGVRIGGIAGGYKYGNLLQRTYVVSPKILRYGRSNSLTVRVWGGNLTFIEKG